jgi:hypothetical protein
MATKAEFENPATRPQVGSGTDAHTSLDFFLPIIGSNEKYPHWLDLVPLVDPTFSNSGNQSFLPGKVPPNLQHPTSYSTAFGGIHEKHTVILQKEVVLT